MSVRSIFVRSRLVHHPSCAGSYSFEAGFWMADILRYLGTQRDRLCMSNDEVHLFHVSCCRLRAVWSLVMGLCSRCSGTQQVKHMRSEKASSR